MSYNQQNQNPKQQNQQKDQPVVRAEDANPAHRDRNEQNAKLGQNMNPGKETTEQDDEEEDRNRNCSTDKSNPNMKTCA
jgi:hypothetical protein